MKHMKHLNTFEAIEYKTSKPDTLRKIINRIGPKLTSLYDIAKYLNLTYRDKLVEFSPKDAEKIECVISKIEIVLTYSDKKELHFKFFSAEKEFEIHIDTEMTIKTKTNPDVDPFGEETWY